MTRLRGFLWLIAGLLIAIIAGFVAYVALARATIQTGNETALAAQTNVVVANRAIMTGQVLTEEDVMLQKVSLKVAPEDALHHLQDAVGQMALTDIYSGEVLLAQRLTNPDIISGDGRIAAVVGEDQVLMALATTDLMSNIGLLKPGDRIDLLFSLDVPYSEMSQVASQENGKVILQALPQQQSKQATSIALENVTIAAIVGPNAPASEKDSGQLLGGEKSGSSSKKPGAVLISIMPQDALMIKYLRDAGAIFDFVLRSPSSERPSDTKPVDMTYIINRYQIPTQ